jgi:hypothetical protein
MITSRAQLAEAQEVARRLSAADWDLSLRLYTSPGDRDKRAVERQVITRKLARLEADIAEYTGSPP